MGGIDPASWFNLRNTPLEALPLVITSLAIGLLMGIERERKHHGFAGIRTYPLTALAGTLCALSLQPLLMAAGLLAVVLLGFLPAARRTGTEDPALHEPHTTTMVALLLAFLLGLLTGQGHPAIATAAGILSTALLYLKPELSGISHRLERRDLFSLLQFAALSLIVLPLLPSRGMGPFDALNPHTIWLMVVLVSGISLSGYLAEKVIGGQVGSRLLGLLGGLVSSTATTLIYARESRAHPEDKAFAASVIRIANLVLLLRLTVVTAALAPDALPNVALTLLPALVLGLGTSLLHRAGQGERRPELTLTNPTDLRVALGFGALFAAIMVLTAWLHQVFGNSGIYSVALISGLNEVDAITLTALDLHLAGTLATTPLCITMALAVLANTLLKGGLVVTIGGRALMRECLWTFLAILAGLGIGLGLLLAA